MLLAVILSFCTLIAANPLTSLYHPPLPTCPASTSFSYVTSQTYTTTKTIIKSHLTTTTYTTTGVRERYCPTFITRVDEPAPWSTCAFDTKTCTRPMCLHLSTITQPLLYGVSDGVCDKLDGGQSDMYDAESEADSQLGVMGMN
ncbi:hypothetical protein CC78DRAFT_575755 [Lojkania enalia]|uniref:Uncharacterized protein n=1 Tax=Lojkania enalia TaxID=147567 RepID=A0A9P4KI60_9PLEO|nr:hypothetical protein CC78DRAFT_575755 [Didymosphaeria enalia]